MVTFKPIIVTSNRHNDGSFPVKIRVTYKGKSRRIPTSLVCKPYDLTRTLKIKSPDIIAKGGELCDAMRATLVDVSPFLLASWDVDQVVAHIKSNLAGDAFRLDFFAYAREFMKGKSEPTARSYQNALALFARHLGKDSIDINDITRRLLQDFIDENTSVRTLAGYVSRLRSLHESAKLKYNDEDTGDIRIPRSPFNGLVVRKYIPGGQKSLGVDLMQKIISYQTADRDVRFALDLFVVSFATMGTNAADLYEMERPAGDVLIYHRRKTRDRRADHAEMRVHIPACIAPYVARLSGRGKHWLCAVRRYSPDSLPKKLRKGLDKFCEAEGIPRFTFYAARHSFATIARKSCGIEKATIDDCLCHVGDYRIADIYAEKSWDLMDEANAKVLALFTWPGDNL